MRVYSIRQRLNHTHPAVRITAGRMHCMLAVMAGLFLLLIARALYLQVAQQDFLVNQGEARFRRTMVLKAHRGLIADRQGEPLAISTPVWSIWANPADTHTLSPTQVRLLAQLLGLKPEEIQYKLADHRREFVYLKRQLDPELADQVMALQIPGIAKEQEYRRFYPAGAIFSHLIGFAGVDGQGQEGVELAREKMLAGQDGHRMVLKDRRGHIIEDVQPIKPPHDGQTLILAADQRIQYLAYQTLKKTVETNKAKAGSVVVLDAQTGELLALVNYPAYNPNNRHHISTEALRNRAVVDTFEPGSTFKPIALSLVLEQGKVGIHTLINTHPYSIGSAPVRDVSPSDALDMTGIIKKSSNVGASKLALLLAPQQVWNYYDALGLGRSPGTGFPGEATGRLRNWKNWRQIEQATMSFGYGMSVSLLQMARAYTLFTHQGALLPITLYKTATPMPAKPILSPQTANAMRAVLIANTQEGGGAVRARVAGYSVGGKTGTVRKLDADKRYTSERHRALFVGFAPGRTPKLIVAIMIDEPQAGEYYGSAIASPAFAAIAGGALRMLNVPPDEPLNQTMLSETAPIPDF